MQERKAQTQEEIEKTDFAWILLLAGVALALLITELMLERFLAQLAEQARHSAFVSSINRSLAESNNLANMLSSCTQHMVTHLDAAIAQIWLFDSSGKVLQLSAGSGTIADANSINSQVPPGRLETELIARDRKPHLTNNVQDSPMIGDKEWAHSKDITAFAGQPLIMDNQVIGVIGPLCAPGAAEHSHASVVCSFRQHRHRNRTEDIRRSAAPYEEGAGRLRVLN